MRKVKVAMIGTGDISGIYVQNITHTFKEIDLVGLCDLIPEKAERRLKYIENAIAEGASVTKPVIYKDMYEAFNDPEVEVILNLTSFTKSCEEKRYIELKTQYERSQAMAHNPMHGILD